MSLFERIKRHKQERLRRKILISFLQKGAAGHIAYHILWTQEAIDYIKTGVISPKITAMLEREDEERQNNSYHSV